MSLSGVIRLKGDFLKAYMQVSAALKRSIADRQFLNEVLEDLIDLLYTSQQEGRNINEVLPNGAKGFIDDIEKTYYKEIPKKAVYLGLLGKAFIYMAIFCLILYLQHSGSMIILIGIPMGLVYAVLMHFIFGIIKNSMIRTIIDFVVYAIVFIVGFMLFGDVAKKELSQTIIFLLTASFGIAGYVISSKRNIFSRNKIRR